MSGSQWGWSGAGANAPVGARLFGTGRQPAPVDVMPNRAQRERAMINALHGLNLYGPEMPPEVAAMLAEAGVAPSFGSPMAATPPPGRVSPAARPVPRFDVEPPQMQLPAVPTEARGQVPPQERANPTAQNPAEANWWDRILRGGPTEELPYPSDRLLPGMQAARERRAGRAEARPNDGLQLGGREMPLEAVPPEELPLPPDELPPPGEEPPPTGPNAPGVFASTRYPTLQARDPDFAAVRAAYERGRPQDRTRDPEERQLRLIASALGGMQGRNGVEVASGAVAGLGAGYARESDRDEALWQRSDDARRQFELGLAGLLGQQEQAQFNNALQRSSFDRTSQIAGDQDARAREGLAIQRDNAGLNRTLTQLRIASLARQVGMGADEGQIFGRGLNALISSPGAQLMVDGRPLTLDVDGQQMTLGQLRAAINARRTDVQTRFMTNPTAYNQQIAGELSDRVMRGIAALPPAQRQQVMQQLARLAENRPRSGTAQVADE